jgi:hypothetical protein
MVVGTGIAVVVLVDAYGPSASTEVPETTLTAALPETGTDAIEEACPGSQGTITGTLALDSLDDDFIEVSVPEGECGDSSITLRIPKAQVKVIRSVGS